MPGRTSGAVQPSVDGAIARVAVILRLLGALWMVLLTAVLALSDDLVRPGVVWGCVAVGVAWAVVAWRAGLITPGPWGPAVAATDLAVTGLLTLLPAFLDEPEAFGGGYPFGSLMVAMATTGRTGTVVAGVLLAAMWLVRIAALGAVTVPFALSNVLLYTLGTVALVLGVDVLRRNETRVRRAEGALAVAQERAATASHLHDSVLQTLALVQRRAEQPNQVRSLARRQERELRQWLFGPGEEAAGGAPQLTVASGLQAAAEDVLEAFGVTVVVVAPGQVAGVAVPEGRDDPLRALLGAAREAMVNAADHSGVDRVDVFAEQGEGQLTVYVRDRGIGFDVAQVPADRHGLRASIVERMARVGGEAIVTSAPGRGTEVRLRLPLPDTVAPVVEGSAP